MLIRPGVPELDYLHGDAAGQGGGTPRHVVQAQGGWLNNGFGVHVGANWQSGTTVDTLTGDNLHFSPLATFDLRLFANFGDMPELTVKHPWLRGSSLRFDVTNIFDSKPRVHDAAGNVPLNYQPDLLDPLGRTIMISFRKLFSAAAKLVPCAIPAGSPATAAATQRSRRLNEISQSVKLCFSARQ